MRWQDEVEVERGVQTSAMHARTTTPVAAADEESRGCGGESQPDGEWSLGLQEEENVVVVVGRPVRQESCPICTPPASPGKKGGKGRTGTVGEIVRALREDGGAGIDENDCCFAGSGMEETEDELEDSLARLD